jgi:AcrR family transcriptional regulator
VPIDPGPTRQKLVDAGTRLFAERGVDAVSLGEINRAAGQRNASALQYHFGGREGLLRAILAPFAEAIRDRRRELIADALAARSDGHVDARRAVEVLVRPQAEYAGGGWRERAQSRIVADLFADPAHPYAEFDDLLGERATAEMGGLLLDALAELPAPVRGERLRVASAFVVHAASDWARHIDATATDVRHPDPVTPVDVFVENLVDMILGALTAPVGAATIPSYPPRR